ncbi:MAG: hypothetical protein EU518_01355 [Promethearchaeota archaeon]|nr:MAG: hypothetical protein EU518_01355 [Candidatus Lokiarchaeota archaeon]
MIRDVLIIKDGLPMFSRNFTDRRNFISDQNNLILVSGFLSALNSFSEEFDDLGSIKELKLSNSNFRLAFLKNNTIPNLIFLASFDEETNSVNVQRFLKKMSYTFLKKYNISKIIDWDGRSNIFDSFTGIVRKYIQDEENEDDRDFKYKVVDLFKEIQEKIEEKPEINSNIADNSKYSKKKQENSKFRKIIPILKITKNFNPDFYLTGNLSKKLLNQINGNKTICDLAEELNISEENVHKTCKNLIKMGFIDLEER